MRRAQRRALHDAAIEQQRRRQAMIAKKLRQVPRHRRVGRKRQANLLQTHAPRRHGPGR
jgi:hypothetical protein